MTVTDRFDVAAIADRYASAWRSHDVDAILAMHAENSSFQSHGRTERLRGEKALRDEFTYIFDRYPGFAVDAHSLLLGDRHWTLHWTLGFTAPDGANRSIRALDVVEIDDEGLVTRKDTFFDFAQVRAAMESAA